MDNKVTVSYIIRNILYNCRNVDEKRAIDFLYEAKKRRVYAYYTYPKDADTFFRCHLVGNKLFKKEYYIPEDPPPTKPGDPGWDPELTEWFYEDD